MRSPMATSPEWNAKIDERFPDLADLTRRYLCAYRERYAVLAATSRNWYRFSGVAVIVLSMSLPLLATVHFHGSVLTLSITSLIIATLSSLRAFYQWDQSWHLYRRQEYVFTAEIGRWEFEMLRLIEANAEDAGERAFTLTREALERAQGSGDSEFDTFFSSLNWPDKTD